MANGNQVGSLFGTNGMRSIPELRNATSKPLKKKEMNVIEDIRDALLHAVEKRSPPPHTPMDLLTALQDSWCEKPPGCLQTLVETMPRLVAALLRARGGPTRY
ncbi:hypothetical protein AVEN_9395-1 [Araneus ventricosus]|uniref:Uncharacterized protein n=1 Tax=Araneus ventricosus TaxID=182803 RepID=A0A4Y2DJD4_ARAVE|nr:hypothetical protein AVEN_9395-1 [Araneus ventricosus]